MFLKSLIISSISGEIRNIPFHLGANLIVDETIKLTDTDTGNNVGKTTVLKLIDFCLGGSPDLIYKDTESKKIFENVKAFLENEKVVITLILIKDFTNSDSQIITIRRNFLSRNKKIMEINGVNLIGAGGKEFEEQLDLLLIGKREESKPTMRQILAHNIRHTDVRINNTLRMVNSYTSLPEYEILFLFMFGIQIPNRSGFLKKLKIENDFRNRLIKHQGKNEVELQLSLINDKLQMLNIQKSKLNINENYENDLYQLNTIKYQISRTSSEISELTLRKDLILETEKELESDISSIDMDALREVYSQASTLIGEVQKSFEDLVEYHNNMIIEKIRFIIQDIPEIDMDLEKHKQKLSTLLVQEKELALKISNSDTFKDLEKIIEDLNSNSHKKGELEKTLSQIIEVEKNISQLDNDIENIDKDIFSEEFSKKIHEQLVKFNRFFSTVSNELYGEEYGITFDKVIEKKSKKQVYSFTSFNDNDSSGKKQGEIICFDLAYILFAREENIPSVDFILNDKKELMHDNQLIKVAEYAKKQNIQLVFSILEDKLPQQLNTDDNIILRLSQEEKLFKIENLSK
ncbi:DUF2326 domain-containing protein [Listeria monocytogenes]|uniref:DUF2326 domain-containing protein n=1 Tax=Listeria monocytogenes TaxID=1639 RepID=UPI00103BAD50|nr:DUF2326 domain-containing protein [Listeria monocytogenes]EAG5591013.1 DUF2326 domain-containing protein [Listeria monocytogenes]MBI1420607.1 DUF2326 domain-containing protein [Listeria monocytogenes]TCD09194.1 DUF2326 domain-containing protein [Listeria monocytogenes]HAA0629454.1 DUF2326 domain-containing protein [Listeria monocytogenes]HAC0528297.1 DUF2326 domain-containing protein [Listeria monocytogenes]